MRPLDALVNLGPTNCFMGPPGAKLTDVTVSLCPRKVRSRLGSWKLDAMLTEQLSAEMYHDSNLKSHENRLMKE